MTPFLSLTKRANLLELLGGNYPDQTHEFCLRAIQVAVRACAPAPGVIHHSDRGAQLIPLEIFTA